MLRAVIVLLAFLLFAHVALGLLTGRCVIVQNKGGGHGSIGYSLSKQLKQKNPSLEVILLQDKCDRKKVPFSSYPELESMGVQIIESKLSEQAAGTAPTALAGMKIDFVVDNWSKKEENAGLAMALAKEGGAKQLLFVSSGGMYKGGGVMPQVETDAIKENDARKIEKAMIASGLPCTFVRPQYIYGAKSNKRYLDYFIGRAFRKLPIPLPLHGEQLLSLTHIDDASSLIAAALGNDKSIGQVFNCASDRYISYKGLCSLVHKALGNEASDCSHLYYEPKAFDNWDGTGVMEFPFRRETFIVSPSKAQQLLGWKATHTIEQDIKEEIAEWEANGGRAEEWSLAELKYDMEIVASMDDQFTFKYPQFAKDSVNPKV